MTCSHIIRDIKADHVVAQLIVLPNSMNDQNNYTLRPPWFNYILHSSVMVLRLLMPTYLTREASHFGKKNLKDMKILTKLLSFCLALVLFVTTLMPSAAMASPSIDPETQQIFILSILSNAASGVDSSKLVGETLEDLLKKRVTDFLKKDSIIQAIGTWDVVWGPVVHQIKGSKYATNSMYVAKKDNQYVVAIAGTNPSSLFDWFPEDFSVKKQVDWQNGDIPKCRVKFRDETDKPKISKGTCIGLKKLEEMKSSDQTVLDFLGDEVKSAGEPTENIEIIFAGHSLGGALSPTLALAALDQQSKWCGSCEEKDFKILVYPSAGPTPGNKYFANYYDSRLGENTTRIWNDIDIVPHAWDEDMLDKIPGLYKWDILPGMAVRALVEIAKDLAGNGEYTQLVVAQENHNLELQGNVNTDLLHCQKEEVSQVIEELEDKILKDPELQRGLYLSNDIENTSSLTQEEQKQYLENFVYGLKPFMKQAGYQHTTEYAVLLDVEEPYSEMFEMFQDNPGEQCSYNLAQLETLVLKLLKEQPQ
ncbi:MAG: lipase family protein [Moorea sp. SIO3G5]|nr:lipase family protein [Moorena sp. SIO3G5]